MWRLRSRPCAVRGSQAPWCRPGRAPHPQESFPRVRRSGMISTITSDPEPNPPWNKDIDDRPPSTRENYRERRGPRAGRRPGGFPAPGFPPRRGFGPIGRGSRRRPGPEGRGRRPSGRAPSLRRGRPRDGPKSAVRAAPRRPRAGPKSAVRAAPRRPRAGPKSFERGAPRRGGPAGRGPLPRGAKSSRRGVPSRGPARPGPLARGPKSSRRGPFSRGPNSSRRGPLSRCAMSSRRGPRRGPRGGTVSPGRRRGLRSCGTPNAASADERRNGRERGASPRPGMAVGGAASSGRRRAGRPLSPPRPTREWCPRPRPCGRAEAARRSATSESDSSRHSPRASSFNRSGP